MRYTTTLRREEFRERLERTGWNTCQLAERMDMSQPAVWRVLAGRTNPGPRFISGALHVFPDAEFRDLFTREASPERAA